MRRAGVRRLLSAPGLCYQRAPRTPYVRYPISGQSRHQHQHQHQQQLCTATRPAAFSASGTHPRAPPAAEEADLLFGYLPRESLPTSSLTNTGMSYTVREQRERREGLLRASVCAWRAAYSTRPHITHTPPCSNTLLPSLRRSKKRFYPGTTAAAQSGNVAVLLCSHCAPAPIPRQTCPKSGRNGNTTPKSPW